MVEILQQNLPIRPWENAHSRRLPGLSPLGDANWLMQDDVYAEQMAYREQLIQSRQDAVHQIAPSAVAAARELLDVVLWDLKRTSGFDVRDSSVLCPDGRWVDINRDAPLLTCGRLVQEDFAVMQQQHDEHVLTGAILCFPASWSLSEKFMKPLLRIHKPVDTYTDNIATRVQRLFDGLRVEQPVWRANALPYDNPDLFQPRSEQEHHVKSSADINWLRVERQVLRKLPESRAVVFSIHTFVLSREALRRHGADLDLICKTS